MTAPAVQADAQAIVDWYRNQLAEVTHRAAFAESALAAERRAGAETRDDLAQIASDLGQLQEAVDRSASEAHWLRPDHPDFPAWVSEHWDAIQDAHLAGMLEAAHPSAIAR